MVLFLRVFLVGLIIYLIVRAFFRYNNPGNEPGQGNQNSPGGKKVSKETGEYIDYEEVDK
jgi:hypothetical protein